jgi:hypothetical protein
VSDAVYIRGLHWAHFRSGEWAELLTIAPDPEGRDCYVVRFPDGVTDFWVVGDPENTYEFADQVPA